MHLKGAIVIECGGVGYECLVTEPSDFPIGESMFVYVCEIRNESDNYLVGFRLMAEKKMFLALTSVKGIGPKIAMSALSYTTVEALAKAINENDEFFLMKIPGLGRKNASQIILDLKGKLDWSITNRTLSYETSEVSLAFDALRDLGFKKNEIDEVFRKEDFRDMTTEQIIAMALKKIKR